MLTLNPFRAIFFLLWGVSILAFVFGDTSMAILFAFWASLAKYAE